MEFVLWVDMNERHYGNRLAFLALCIGVTDMSFVLNIHRCACVSALLTRGHQFKHDVTTHPRRLHMVLILESPHQDLDIVELVTVFV